jgi:hypothetical protein
MIFLLAQPQTGGQQKPSSALEALVAGSPPLAGCRKHRPSYFGLRISDFFGFFQSHSAIGIPH